MSLPITDHVLELTTDEATLLNHCVAIAMSVALGANDLAMIATSSLLADLEEKSGASDSLATKMVTFQSALFAARRAARDAAKQAASN